MWALSCRIPSRMGPAAARRRTPEPLVLPGTSRPYCLPAGRLCQHIALLSQGLFQLLRVLPELLSLVEAGELQIPVLALVGVYVACFYRRCKWCNVSKWKLLLPGTSLPSVFPYIHETVPVKNVMKWRPCEGQKPNMRVCHGWRFCAGGKLLNVTPSRVLGKEVEDLSCLCKLRPESWPQHCIHYLKALFCPHVAPNVD